MLSHPDLIREYPFRFLDEPNRCYYANDEQCKTLLKRDIQLPDDYYFTDLCEEDAKQICAEQIYTSSADEKFVALRIRSFPGVGAICKSTEKSGHRELACYEISDGLGVITLLYCQKQHRGKRLGTLVEEKVCQRNLAEQGIRPYKGVSINRPRVIEMTAKNYLWTICKDEKNNDELYYNAIWTREDKGQLTLYED